MRWGAAAPAPACLAGDPHCGSVITGYVLETPQGTAAVPLAVGGSTTIAFDEKLCTGTSSQSPLPPSVHLGCQAPFAPSTLTITVAPVANEGVPARPCGVDGVLGGPGIVTFTRTAPGDPRLFAGPNGVAGFCNVTVSDPTRSDGNLGHPATTVIL